MENRQAKLRFCLTNNEIDFSVHTDGSNKVLVESPYSYTEYWPWIVSYPVSLLDGEEHYWVCSIDCSEVYNSSNTAELEEYEGDFYSSKIFVDGELLYDTYYSKEQYDFLKKYEDTLNLKYFTIGRCSMANDGYWHYAKMNTYCMRLYNRGLSNEEMLENYNTTKAYYSAVIEN